MVARGDHIDGSRGHILIEHDVVAHDGILKGAQTKRTPENGGCSAIAGSISSETALIYCQEDPPMNRGAQAKSESTMSQKTGTCKLCGEMRTLCDSHAIPNAFFRDAQKKEPGLNLVTPERTERNKFGGEYAKLLCRECEGRLSRYDDYGIRFFRGTEGTAVTHCNGEEIPSSEFLLLLDVDIKMLRLFVIAVLWRASISPRPFYQGVRLGAYEGQARDILLNDREPSEEEFPFFIVRYNETDVAQKMLIGPTALKFGEADVYNVNLGTHYCVVKVDRKPFPDSVGRLLTTLNQKKLILVARKDLRGSGELEAIAGMVRSTGAQDRTNARADHEPGDPVNT